MTTRPLHSTRTMALNSARTVALVMLLLFSLVQSAAQTVPIRFRYQPAATYVRVHFPGQFNNWGPNSSGTIAAGTPSQADSLESSTGLWVKTIPLAFGTHQYKIYRQLSATPTNWSWIPDPLNRVVIAPDQNSQFTVDSLVLFQICAFPHTMETGPGGTLFVVRTGTPRLSAGVFRPVGAPAPNVEAWIDGVGVQNAASYRSAVDGIFTYVPTLPLADGMHVFTLRVSAGTLVKTDSVRFEVRARPVQILTPPFSTVKSVYLTGGIVLKADASGPDSAVASATISVNGASRPIPVNNGRFLDSTLLEEGVNRIVVIAMAGTDSVTVTRRVRHAPTARASATDNGATVTLDASGTTDPDGQQVVDFVWVDDPALPLGLAGQTGVTASITRPAVEGEYFFGLIARDPDGNADTTRSYFILTARDSLENPTIASNPAWARQARVYFLFPKAASPAGTINGAAARLPSIRALGFSVIWMMPVMDNAFPIDNGVGPGYNIVDFRNVAPEYGTNQDFKNFVAQAHALGMKVILDVTPNHTGRLHPWADNARTLREMSPYWNWYQHTIIPHNDNGLGQSLDGSGFNYYSGFSDQLLNYNWIDEDARAEMIDVYRYWIREFGLDGYRFDVYWGPHRRYGERYMGQPVREALKHIKPDILLLAEDDGTGPGTEQIYADFVSALVNGGVDAAYDFRLFFSNFRNFGFGNAAAVNALHANIDNGGFYPGPNALYMRFMESQDEDRIYYTDPAPSSYYDPDPTTAFVKTMPVATVLFTAPGFPMIWNGQEVGWGYGIAGSKLARNRSVIDWNFQGKTILEPHYQKLAHIRGQFRAFTQHKRDTNGDGFINASDASDFVRVPSTNGLVYAFTRPWQDRNGLTVVNLSGSVQAATLDLSGAGVIRFSGGLQPGATYYLNNLYDVRSEEVTATGLAQLNVTLSPYGSAIYTVSVTRDTVHIVTSVSREEDAHTLPERATLHQNFPNPFNPATTIRFDLPEAGRAALRVFDLLGRELATITDGERGAGSHEAVWDGRTAAGVPAGSGVYFYRMEFVPASGAPAFTQTRSMILVK